MSTHGFRARLHEPGLAANPGQVACLVQLHAFDWKRVDPAWRPVPGWQPTRVHVNRPLDR